MTASAQIQTLINDIIKGYEPEKIYLFGSYASHNATEDSDIDLLIIKTTKTRFKDRSAEVRKIIQHYPLTPLDIFVYTPEEIKHAESELVNIGKEAIKKGKLLYERA